MTLHEVIEKHIKNALYLMLDDDDRVATYFVPEDGNFFEDLKFSRSVQGEVDLIIQSYDGVQFFFRNENNQDIVHDRYDFHLHDVNGVKYYVSMLDLVRIT